MNKKAFAITSLTTPLLVLIGLWAILLPWILISLVYSGMGIAGAFLLLMAYVVTLSVPFYVMAALPLYFALIAYKRNKTVTFIWASIILACLQNGIFWALELSSMFSNGHIQIALSGTTFALFTKIVLAVLYGFIFARLYKRCAP